MIDLAQIVGFDWDEGNRSKSVEKHSVSQAEAEQVFADSQLLIADDVRHSEDEARYQALGRTVGGRLVHITFTLRYSQTKIRVIFARGMNRKERASYEQKA
ncbi:MAG: BrnT family toxin [Xanthobacteraceae bacterium]